MKRRLLSVLLLAGLATLTTAIAQPAEPTPILNATHRIHLPQLINDGGALDRRTTQWSPHVEWLVPNPSHSGNPHDLVARATFTHVASGERRVTGMFYAGGDTWAFRFVGTRPGLWRFTTASADADLAGLRGSVYVVAASGQNGFVTIAGDKWLHQGSGRAFVPQFVMAPSIDRIDDAWISWAIQTFIVEHGFSGFHLSMNCRWFQIEVERCADVDSPNPDPRTFERLERLITRTYAAGGVVHIWMWGDSSRGANPSIWGLNDTEDRRLQRHIAARLGPLPGWTMSYGFDLWEWVSGPQLEAWRDFMRAEMAWDHPLGARGETNKLTQLSEEMDYASYEQHKPNLATYLATIAARPAKPSFSEDRFRVRDGGQAKDYTFEETRRGLWQSAMAGGVANIWGNLSGGRDSDLGSLPYPNAAQLRTYARFFAQRFDRQLGPCGGIAGGACLRLPDHSRYLFYREGADSLFLDLSRAGRPLRAVAVDTRRPYAEIDLGQLSPTAQTWRAPYSSDWAIAAGE